MPHVPILQDLFDHNDWANARIFTLAEELSGEQLDQPREMGFGSLRNTLFHTMEAERIWLERWRGDPWRPLVVDAGGMSVAAIKGESVRVAGERNALLHDEVADGLQRSVTFKDGRQNDWTLRLGDMMSHVVNHGVHHRAQSLSYLKSFGKTVPAGLDYLFWKLSRPSCEAPEASLAPLRSFGLEAAVGPGQAPEFDRGRIEFFFAYSEWAMDRVLGAAAPLDDPALDRDFGIGHGTLRRSLQHMIDAERWWLDNWREDRSPFPRGEEPRSLAEMRDLHASVARRRNEFVAAIDPAAADRVVTVTAGGPDTCFRVTESFLQLCCHGTHHRCQCLNMLRQSGVEAPGIDLVLWLRGR